MPRLVYRYAFNDSVDFVDVLATVDLAIIAVQSTFGEERARLDARFTSNPDQRILVIDAATEVGQSLNELLLGYARREFGERAFSVSRISDEPTGIEEGPCVDSL